MTKYSGNSSHKYRITDSADISMATPMSARASKSAVCLPRIMISSARRRFICVMSIALPIAGLPPPMRGASCSVARCCLSFPKRHYPLVYQLEPPLPTLSACTAMPRRPSMLGAAAPSFSAECRATKGPAYAAMRY